MAIQFDTPLNLYRANVGLALRMLSLSYDSRQHACEFEMQRIKRDVAALNATRDATSLARDWSDLASSYQAALRDYMVFTNNLWQQALVSTARQQSAYSDGMRDALARWQSEWTDNWQKSTGLNPTSTPLHGWLQRIEQLVAGAPDGRNPSARYAGTDVPSVEANGRWPQGEHHVG